MHNLREHLTFERKNIANLITLGRFTLYPVIIILFFQKHKAAMVAVWSLNGLLDIVDGYFARKLKIESGFGNDFDLVVDYLVNITVFILVGFSIGEAFLKVLRRYWYWLALLIGSVLLAHLVSVKKVGKGASLHLFTSKVGGIAFIAFIAVFYLFGFSPILGLITVLLLITDHLEQTMIFLIAGKDTDRNWRSVIEAMRYVRMRE